MFNLGDLAENLDSSIDIEDTPVSEATLATAEAYREKGWTAAFPLPAGEKYPPVTGVTGKIDVVDWDRISKFWASIDEDTNANLGLRLQTDHPDFDICAIDVDHYDTKTGDEFLRGLEAQLGSLGRDENWRSTRRGVDNPSGQSFYKIPKGRMWNASVCEDVEFVCMTHRYSAVWPSVKDDKQYRWIDPEGNYSTDIPAVEDLPWLPERWVQHLERGKRGPLPKDAPKRAFKGNKTDQVREATSWLRDNIPGWNEGANAEGERNEISPSLAKVSMSEEVEDNLVNNGHDTMVSAVHAAVRLGCEGHVGLKAALTALKRRFVRTVVEGGRRSRDEAIAEFNNALVGEVEALRYEIEAGDTKIYKYDNDLAMPNFSDLLIAAETEKKPRGISDLSEYRDNDHDHARLFADYWKRDCLANRNGPKDREFSFWSTKTGRYTFRHSSEMYGLIIPAVAERLEFEAGNLLDTSEQLKARMEEGQISGGLDPEEIEAQASTMFARANRLRNTQPQNNLLRQLHSIPEIKVEDEAFDSQPGLIGIQGGKTLDITGGDIVVRDSLQRDMLTMSTGSIFERNAQHPALEKFLDTFLPDPVIRRFTQKALGYSLIDGNPEKLIVFLFGPNHTGKTTILEACMEALGDYAAPMNAMKLLGRNTGGPNSEVLNNVAKRMVVMSEVGTDHKLSANMVKQVTGNDSQQLRGVHSSTVINRTPSFTPYVSTNTIPEIDGGDQALRNRLLIIPFNQSHKEKVAPEDSIFQETVRPAIFWWLLEGMKMAQQEGLGRDTWPEQVLKLSEEFSSGLGPIHQFVADRIRQTGNPKDRVLAKDLEMAWDAWATAQDLTMQERGSISEFRKTMGGLGMKRTHTTVKGVKNTYIYRGVELA